MAMILVMNLEVTSMLCVNVKVEYLTRAVSMGVYHYLDHIALPKNKYYIQNMKIHIHVIKKWL